MPRGVPLVRKDEVPVRFTLFHIPPQMNQKHGGSNYLKTEEQTIWGRNKKMAKNQAGEGTQPADGRRGSNVLIIHPGTRFLRIGRASDVFPVTIPHVIARRSNAPIPPPVHISSIAGMDNAKEKGKEKAADGDSQMEVDSEREAWDPIDPKTSPIAASLRERMLFYKLEIDQNAAETCTAFNEKVKPEVILDHNDPYRVEWLSRESAPDVLIGEKALCIGDPDKLGYTVRWPLHGSHFNSFGYVNVGLQALLNDIETIWRLALLSELKIEQSSYKDYSVILIIPDLFERSYVRELAEMLLVQMGFKQICVQQESITATYGAGVSNACVIDAGAAKTSIAIVDDGLVLSDTRISLNMGGDDVTEYLLALLERVHFPYREVNLARSYDWNLLEDLKARICTLAEGDVALNLYDFVIRRPGKPTEKYALRAYNEIILAPMCVFEPRVIEFEHKLVHMRPISNPNVSEEIVAQVGDQITQAMVISTQHLLPPPAPIPPNPPAIRLPLPELDAVPDLDNAFARPTFAAAPQSAAPGPPQLASFARHSPSKAVSQDASDVEMAAPSVSTWAAPTAPMAPEPAPARAEQDALPAADVALGQPGHVYPQPGSYVGEFGIDVAFEASKLPLDVAIFNSARAAGGDEKIRKYLQAVLVVGGSARIPGVAHALESRLQAIASPLVPNMEKVQIIAPPRDVDPRVLCWKGAALLGKMDAVADLWVQRSDWDVLGMRALKERSFFL